MCFCIECGIKIEGDDVREITKDQEIRRLKARVNTLKEQNGAMLKALQKINFDTECEIKTMYTGENENE